ncbi:MAG: metallophosphoesterase [Leptospiraceae bacterium]|nr:metallophosphoesterase [Leptospiraceae bacterium]
MPFAFLKRKKGRTIFIGDVHGCLAELRQMIQVLRVQPIDRVILLGDLINRGPDSAGVVAYVAERGFECLMGNHESEYLAELDSSETYQKLYQQLGPTLHSWIVNRLYYIESDLFMAVHAGLEPGKHPAESRPGVILNIRTWDGSGKDMKNPQNPAWYSLYTGQRPVVYGHWARAGLNLRPTTIGLDSGCVYGRFLSAWILEEKRVVQVPAERVYYVPPALRK